MNKNDLISLLEAGELLNVEFKQSSKFEGDFRAHIAMSIASMANSNGGGHILIGIVDDKREIDGVLTKEIIETWEITKLSLYLEERLSTLPSITPYLIEIDNKFVLCIKVQEFSSEPIIVKKDLQDQKGKPLANTGDILIRTEGRQTRKIRTVEEMRSIINRSVIKRSGLLLADIERIFNGKNEIVEVKETILNEIYHSISSNEVNFRSTLHKDFPNHCKYSLEIYFPEAEQQFEKSSDLYEILNSTVINDTFNNFPIYYQERNSIKQSYDFLYLDTQFRKWIFHKKGYFIYHFIPWTEYLDESPQFPYPNPPNRPLFVDDLIRTMSNSLQFAFNLSTIFSSGKVKVYLKVENLLKKRIYSLVNRMSYGEPCSEYQIELINDTFFRSNLQTDSLDIINRGYEKALIIFQIRTIVSEDNKRFVSQLLNNG
ncbi:ATP-binding protein [Leptospira fletcheri]|uniref:ATP-binding protein n=1 Tax=Leptospira fletcheri TaxID=2484981 RepID=A0A4R9GBB9_9LEPT|nr:ATP-binding protein [Leptospira fletcheri]TGK08994.1 ATP-binding protein [Leptospira fletcheri]